MKCQKCGIRPSTVNWIGEGGVLDWAHGMYARWCEICCLSESIKHNRKIAANLPKQEKKLKKLLSKQL